jgi:cytochrome P450
VDGPIYDWFVPMIVNHDGPPHLRLRGLVSKAFTPRMINNLKPFIRAQAERLTERIAAAGEVDFVEEFANPLPLAVMCELLGVPPEDYDVFRVWTTDIGLIFGLAHGGDIAKRVETAIVGLDGYVTLVFGAHDSTRHQLSNAMVTFAEHPDQWTTLGRHPELADRAVEEVMRWHPSVTTAYRFAAEDFDYRGLHIAAGTFLTMCVTGAQRDPRTFHNGQSFDITVPREAPVLQFGAGPHHCLGAALARAELGVAFPTLATRLGPPVIAGRVSWRPPIGIHGPDRLPLRFTRN